MIDRPLQTFSVAFKERAFSELDYARQVSTAIKADAHEIVIDDHDFFGALPRLIWHEDEPIAHPSSVPLYFVSAARPRARQGRADRRRQRRAARRLRQVSARARQLARRRAPTASCRQPVRAWIADTRRAAPAGARRAATRSRSFLAMPRTPEAMFFDNFAAIGLRAPARAARRRASPAPRPADAYGAVARVLRRAERPQHARSIGCSTPTSRRTWSSC